MTEASCGAPDVPKMQIRKVGRVKKRNFKLSLK